MAEDFPDPKRPKMDQAVMNQLMDQVKDQMMDQVIDQVKDQMMDQVIDQVKDQMMEQVIDQVKDQVKEQVEQQVKGMEKMRKKRFMEENLPPISKRKRGEEELPEGIAEKLQLLKDGKLQPSSAMWEILKMNNDLPCITTLLSMKPSPEHEDEEDSRMSRCEVSDLKSCMKFIRNSLPTNEGYSTLICGNIVAHVVDELNKKDSLYRFEIFPVVQQESDTRNNKQSDYSIFKIYNKRTYIMIEVKLDVPFMLTAATKDNLAQLFLEAIYCQSNEGKREMMCVLTNGFIWHCIVTEFRHRPLKFLKYFKILIDADNYYKDAKMICQTLTNYVHIAALETLEI